MTLLILTFFAAPYLAIGSFAIWAYVLRKGRSKFERASQPLPARSGRVFYSEDT